MREGKFSEALEQVDAQILHDSSIEAEHLRGELLFKLGRLDEAMAVLENNLHSCDNCNKSLDLWVHICNATNRLPHAVDILHTLSRRFPQSVEYVYGLATIQNRLGNFEAARDAYLKAFSLSPTNYLIANSLAKLELITGNISKAVEIAQASLDLFPYNPDSLRIVNLEHQYQYGDHCFTQLNLASTIMADYSSMDQVQLHYSLAKAYIDVGEYASAFKHYEVAGQKHQSIKSFDREKIKKIYQNLIRCVTSQNLSAVKEQGCPSNVPVFIVGMPRSGTTLMEQILASHPQVYGAGELEFLGKVVDGMRCGTFKLSIGVPDPLFPASTEATWQERGEAYVNHLSLLTDDKRYSHVIDKMPANYHYVGMIKAILPNATIIHSMRHPMEVCFSCYKTLFTAGHEWSFRLEDLAYQYRQYWEIITHWRREFPDLLFDVFYENLVENTEYESRRILKKIGLEWDSSCLDFHRNDRPIKTASVTQVRKPIYKTATNRWQRYDQYLKPLAEQLSDIIREYEQMLQRSRINAEL